MIVQPPVGYVNRPHTPSKAHRIEVNTKCEDSYVKGVNRFDTYGKLDSSPGGANNTRPIDETIKHQKSLQLTPLDLNKAPTPHSPKSVVAADTRLNSNGANTLTEPEHGPIRSGKQSPLRNMVQIGVDALMPVNIQTKL